MASYLTLAEYKARTLLPSTYQDAIEAIEPGWVTAMLTYESAWINSLLRKRYAAPFDSPCPDVVLAWLIAMADERVLLKRGVDATDAQVERLSQMADMAREDVKEAAKSDTGLFDLPLRQDTIADGIQKGAPLSSSEAGPYAWTTNQRNDADYDSEPTL